jgi:hypothetical protein
MVQFFPSRELEMYAVGFFIFVKTILPALPPMARVMDAHSLAEATADKSVFCSY